MNYKGGLGFRVEGRLELPASHALLFYHQYICLPILSNVKEFTIPLDVICCLCFLQHITQYSLPLQLPRT